ncbi:MAG TPA: CGNR zinc finger domain-containing protein [Candidatus Dormibacteraeota bacterium]|nr:CGNR zinc finger domain-containing protein [Candidatus Dormibacteraeota bacterium]
MAHTHHDHRLDVDASLAFINTLEHSASGDEDELVTFDTALGWLVEHGALHESSVGDARREDGDHGLDLVRRARAALREVVDAAVEARPPTRAAVTEINRLLATIPPAELVATADGVIVGHRHDRDALRDALAKVASPIADLLADGRPERLHVCDNDQCRWVFYDTSPTGRRRWCDMGSCGNRAKAARHRARRRAGGGLAASEERAAPQT